MNNGILQQFDKQRSRGTQGFGLFDGQETNIVRAAKEDKILKWLVRYDSNLLMFHHRQPTSTVNVKKAAHPFSTKKYFGNDQYIMVHNGIIYNDDELFVAHQEKGIKYQSLLHDGTFNDSEALLWDLALTLEGKQKELTARGPIAFVCVKLHKGKLDKLYFGRNVNPLNMFRHKDGIALSSEGEGEPIDSHTLHTFNYKLKRVTKKLFVIPSSYSNYTPSNYDNYNYERGRAGDWLPRPLRDKYSDYLDYDRDGNPIWYDREYEPDPETQMLLPVGTREIVSDDDVAQWELEEDLEPYKPMGEQTETKALNYLLKAKGKFEVAYWDAEDDYEKALEEDDNTIESLRRILLLEAVLELIENDPEYKNKKSISSLWGALWEQQRTA